MHAPLPPGPWEWRLLGGKWHLTFPPGARIVLTSNLDNSVGDWDSPGCPEIVTRDESGTLVPLTPDMPVALALAAVPDLIAALEQCVRTWGVRDLFLLADEQAALDNARAAIAKAKLA